MCTGPDYALVLYYNTAQSSALTALRFLVLRDLLDEYACGALVAVRLMMSFVGTKTPASQKPGRRIQAIFD